MSDVRCQNVRADEVLLEAALASIMSLLPGLDEHVKMLWAHSLGPSACASSPRGGPCTRSCRSAGSRCMASQARQCVLIAAEIAPVPRCWPEGEEFEAAPVHQSFAASPAAPHRTAPRLAADCRRSHASVRLLACLLLLRTDRSTEHIPSCNGSSFIVCFRLLSSSICSPHTACTGRAVSPDTAMSQASCTDELPSLNALR